MAAIQDVTIRIEIEPVVKLTCLNFDCRHNLAEDPLCLPYCNLKCLQLDETGKCSAFERAEV
jgi:hypothetical protein